MKNKKKLFAIALAVCLIAILSFGTLAYFTDTDSVTNTFTIGSIKVQQHEKDGAGNDFVQDQTMLPIVNTEDPSADVNYIDKVVTVENTGKNPAYIRTWIAIPTALKDYLHLDTDTTNGWVMQWALPTTTVDGVKYTCYCYVYSSELASGKTTPALLKGVYLDAKVDVKTNPASGNLEFCMPDDNGGYTYSGFAVQDAEGTAYKVNVLVATQAVQREGFADAQAALNAAFGEPIHETSVPWYVAA